MTMFLHWAAASVDDTGAAINFDDGFVAGSFAHPGVGVYTMTLTNQIGDTEACLIVTPRDFGGILPVVTYRAHIAADGVSITIRFFSLAGLPTDSPFSVVISRFAPG